MNAVEHKSGVRFRVIAEKCHHKFVSENVFTMPYQIQKLRSHDCDKICPVLGYYAASSGTTLPTFRDNICFKGQEVR